MSWHFKKTDIPYAVWGAKWLGCGGGGDPWLIGRLLESVMEAKDTIEIRSFHEVAEEFVVSVAFMGSPALLSENIPSGWEGLRALELYEQRTGRRAECLAGIEIGGLNALSPLVAAVQRKLPVLDGDGMGRAFPELDMCTYSFHDFPVNPLVMVGRQQEAVIVNDLAEQTLKQSKEWLRKLEGTAFIACYGGEGRKLRSALLPGTLRLAVELGRVILQAGLEPDLKQQVLAQRFENTIYGGLEPLFNGRVERVDRQFREGTFHGEIRLLGGERWSGQQLEIGFQNEFLYARAEEKLLLTAPDLLVLADPDSLKPYAVEEIHSGMAVQVWAIPAPNALRTKAVLTRTGPQAFGLPFSYLPFEGREEG